MSAVEILSGIEAWPVLQAIGDGSWWIALDAAHILFQALVVGSIALVDLRLLGLCWRSAKVAELSRRILPWTWIGFGGAAATGLLLFLIQWEVYLFNRAFWLKIAFMGLAGVNMAIFHAFTWRGVDQWDDGRPTPVAAKAAGFLSMLFWLCSIMSARYIWFPGAAGGSS